MISIQALRKDKDNFFLDLKIESGRASEVANKVCNLITEGYKDIKITVPEDYINKKFNKNRRGKHADTNQNPSGSGSESPREPRV